MIRKKILFVDDDPDIVEVMAMKFEDKYDVHTATSGEEALRIKKHEFIHVIITDLNMPVMDGMELCRAIKAKDPFAYIIAFTGHWDLYELVACREIGFDDYITKPINDELIQEIVSDAYKKVDRWLDIINNPPGPSSEQE